MEKIHLLRSQKNEVFQLLESFEINTSEFRWTWNKKDCFSIPCPVLEHKFYEYYFCFSPPDPQFKRWSYKCCPGHYNPTDTMSLEGDRWEHIFGYVQMWASDLRFELKQPDLWSVVGNFEFNTLSYDQNKGNIPFTFEETEQIAEKLKKLNEKVTNIASESDVPKGKIDSVSKNMQRLEESAKKGVGRIDWINQLTGLLINIAVQFSMNPESANQFFSFVRELFSKGLNLFKPKLKDTTGTKQRHTSRQFMHIS